MISEFFLNIIFNLVNGMFEVLPEFTWSIDANGFEIFLDIIKIVGYLLPWPTVIAIFDLTVVLIIFRIIVATIKTVWDILPLV